VISFEALIFRLQGRFEGLNLAFDSLTLPQQFFESIDGPFTKICTGYPL
jgi:hypothetical protein